MTQFIKLGITSDFLLQLPRTSYRLLAVPQFEIRAEYTMPPLMSLVPFLGCGGDTPSSSPILSSGWTIISSLLRLYRIYPAPYWLFMTLLPTDLEKTYGRLALSRSRTVFTPFTLEKSYPSFRSYYKSFPSSSTSESFWTKDSLAHLCYYSV